MRALLGLEDRDVFGLGSAEYFDELPAISINTARFCGRSAARGQRREWEELGFAHGCHSITSSARPRIDGGIVRPRAFARSIFTSSGRTTGEAHRFTRPSSSTRAIAASATPNSFGNIAGRYFARERGACPIFGELEGPNVTIPRA